ncbi:hypothetical protein JW796_02205 [Candidatus Dojkabacteria bacterium]|nr:hypothetical protein [Candidatus Dojkabacteria bacterium]
MDEKYTLASYFTSITAFITGYTALSAMILQKQKKIKIQNIVFGLFFLILSLDEYFEIHEYANSLAKSALKGTGMFSSLANLSWLFPLSIIILAVFAFLITKIVKAGGLARKAMIAGSVCFFVVLVFELFGSLTYGQNIYLYFVAVEEGLEMIGVSFFLLGILVDVKDNKQQ